MGDFSPRDDKPILSYTDEDQPHTERAWGFIATAGEHGATDTEIAEAWLQSRAGAECSQTWVAEYRDLYGLLTPSE